LLAPADVRLLCVQVGVRSAERIAGLRDEGFWCSSRAGEARHNRHVNGAKNQHNQEFRLSSRGAYRLIVHDYITECACISGCSGTKGPRNCAEQQLAATLSCRTRCGSTDRMAERNDGRAVGRPSFRRRRHLSEADEKDSQRLNSGLILRLPADSRFEILRYRLHSLLGPGADIFKEWVHSFRSLSGVEGQY